MIGTIFCYETRQLFTKRFCATIILLILLPVIVKAGKSDLLNTVINNAATHQQNLPPLAFDSQTLTYSSAGILPDKPTSKDHLHFRRNGDMVDCVGESYRFNSLAGKLVLSYKTRSLWNGKRYFHRQQSLTGSDKKIQAYVSDKEDKETKKIICNQGIGAFLEGRFWHNTYAGDWISLLEKEDQVSLSDEKQQINEHLCHVIEANTPHGDYKLWIDSNAGYNIRHATITVGSEDLAWGKPLSKQGFGRPPLVIYKIEMEIKDVSIQKVGGRYFGVGGTFLAKLAYSDGSVEHIKRVVKRSNIQFNPDFDAMGAFVMDLPDGTNIRHKQMPVIKYMWVDGELVPDVDELVIDELDKMAGRLNAEEKVLKEKDKLPDAEKGLLIRQDKVPAESEVATVKKKSAWMFPPVAGVVSIAVLSLGFCGVIWYVIGRKRAGKT